MVKVMLVTTMMTMTSLITTTIFPSPMSGDSDGDGTAITLTVGARIMDFTAASLESYWNHKRSLTNSKPWLGHVVAVPSISLGGYGDDSNGPMTDLSPISTLVHVGGTLGIGASELETLPQMSLETVGLLKLDTT